ncbi:MAG: lamin tail domain-containing protein [Lentisphaerae bacterium]|nr:lamin tail domain-containing protein [Lentisphaerota bacterium]
MVAFRLWRVAVAAGLAALLWRPGPLPAAVVINEFLAINGTGLADADGDRPDWIELWNGGTGAVSLAGWRLTDDSRDLNQWTFPATTIPAGGYLVVFASGKNRAVAGQPLHTNFKLKGEGEYLALVRPDGAAIEDAYAPAYPLQFTDISFGRTTNLDAGVGYFTLPTPGSVNAAAALAQTAATTCSAPHGTYTSTITVAISCLTTGAQVRYTRDGSAPVTNSMLYGGPLVISNTTILRARAFAFGHVPSDSITQTYLFLADVARQPANPAGFPATWSGSVADYAMEDNTNDLKLVAGDVALSVEQARQVVQQSLAGLPSVSLVMSIDDWFSASSGIYANALNEGPPWERACSVEFLPWEGEPGFQINAGVEMHGGTARYPNITPKHAIQVSFKNEFGPASLAYRVFTNAPVEVFNTLVLRSDVRDCWTSPGDYGDGPNPRSQATYLRDPWLIESQRDLGAAAPGRRFVHLYLNGMYWGVYDLTERTDNVFAAARLGGDSAAYDTVHNVYPPRAIEGDLVKWDELRTKAAAGLASNDAYQGIQGNDADGTRNPAREILCDVQSLLQVLLPGQYAAPHDWPGNWFGNRLRGADSIGFHFSNWDGDLGFVPGRIDYDRVTIVGGSNFNDTWGIVDKGCRLNAEYRLRYADFIHRHFFHGGALTGEAAAARWRRLAEDLRPGMVAESARWGDYRRDVHPYETPPFELYTPARHWEPTVQSMATNHVAARHPVLLQQYRQHGLYPAVAAPEFLVQGVPQYGGAFAPGATLTLAASNTIYFTLDGTDPRQYGTGAAVGTAYSGALPLTHAMAVSARALSGTTWSALAEAVFVPAQAPVIRLTELMFHPRDASGQTNWVASDFEFIEFQNQGEATAGLAGLRFTAGINFDFTGSAVRALAPGQFVLVVANRAAFASRYPGVPASLVAGEFTRSFAWPKPVLRDEGEAVRLVDARGSNLVAFTYRDARGWPLAAAGAGHSLVPAPGSDQTQDLDYGGNWRASAWRDGSPGAADPAPVTDVVLNEFAAHTDYTNGQPWQDANDWVELYHAGTAAVVFADWYLSDRASDLKLWALPPSLTLQPGHWLVLDEVTGFHPATNSGFGLNKAGDEIFLSHLPGNGKDRVVDAVRFKAQEADSTEGRWPDGGAWWQGLLGPTANTSNTPPVGRVVITEFMPQPPALDGAAGAAAEEFVEIRNTSAATVTLANAAGAWRLTGEVEYTFSGAPTLDPGEHLVVVGFDPEADPQALAAFRAHYSQAPAAGLVVGPWQGTLDNLGGRLALERPQAGDQPGESASWVIVDEVIYYSRSPWPGGATGSETGLQRADAQGAGSAPDNWYAPIVPSPGAAAEGIVLVRPSNGEVCFSGETVQLLALADTASLASPLGAVTFRAGTNVLAVVPTAPFACSWSIPAAGSYRLSATMATAAGAVTSATVVVHALSVGTLAVREALDADWSVEGSVMGERAADITVYWGETDGGTNREAWAAGVPVGSVSNATYEVQALAPRAGTTYYVRACGRRGAHEGWSSASTMFTTISITPNWPWRLPLTFSGYTGTEALVEFPALVTFSTNTAGFRYELFNAGWGSLRFVDDGGRSLPYEVELWDTNGTSHVWVALGALTNGAAITAYWGGGVTGAPAYTRDGSTWRGGFEGVWHLGASLADATGHGHDALDMGSTVVTGRAGAARAFDGFDDALCPQLEAAWYGQSLDACTISIWASPQVVSNMTVFGTATNAAALRLAARNIPLRYWRYDVGNTVSSPHTFALNQWQMFSLVLSNGYAYAALNDGALVALTAFSPFTLAGAPWIGAGTGGQDRFKGAIDEARVSGRARSAAWLQAEYRTLARPDTFVTCGAVAAQPRLDVDADGMPDAWERQAFGAIDVPAGQAGADWDGDGMLNVEEYTAGTDPTNAASVFALRPGASNGMLSVTFDSLAAQGDGYEGLTRYYDLLGATSLHALADGLWMPVDGMTNVQGQHGVRTWATNATPWRFFSGTVRLE